MPDQPTTTENPIRRIADIWRAEAAKIADELARAECLALIADWEALRLAVSAVAASADVTSYSIAGRTVTRSAMASVRREAENLADEIMAMLGRGGAAPVADLRRAFIP